MSDQHTDRALLVGILALQMDFIDRRQWLRAMRIWSGAKSRRVEDILLEIGALRPDTFDFVIAMTNKHLEMHDQDVEKSLAAISSLPTLRDELRSINDPSLDETLQAITPSGSAHVDGASTLTLPSGSSSHERFRILRPHAKGGLGEVSVARDQELNREVALKEIQERYVRDPASRSRFVLEAEITGGLEHPGVVPVYSLGQYKDGRPFYAMRFIRGDSLKEAIADFHRGANVAAGPGERMLRLRKLLGRFVDVCDAVAYAHSRGILHRDLKPGNIMLGKYGETMVVDWGLAKPLGHGEHSPTTDEGTLMPRSGDSSVPTQVGTSIGTPGYMSPEQAEGQLERLGPTTDVYSLGATLYCLLAGKAPISGEDRTEFLRKVRRGEFPRPSELDRRIPKPLEAICLKALATDPRDRYPTTRELADDIERWLADEPIDVYRELPFDRFARAVRHHRSAFAAAGALLLSASLALAVITALMRHQNRNLRAAREVAEANAERAEGNLRVARDWARQLLSLAEGLARLPGQGQLRKKMTDDSLHVFQELHKNQPNDPALRQDLARVLRYWANVMLADDLPAALKANQDAVELLNPLAEDPLQKGELRDQLAETLRDQGNLLKRMGRLSDAAKAFERALEIAAALRQANPDNLGYLRTETTVKSDLASLLILLEQFDQALDHSNSAVSALRELADGKQARPLDQLLLLLAMQTNAELHRRLEHRLEALNVLTEALRRAKSHNEPDRNLQYVTGSLLMEQSHALAMEPPQLNEARVAIDQSVEVWERLAREASDSNRHDTYRQYHARALNRRADLQAAAKEYDASQGDLDQARAICESLLAKSPENRSYGETMVETLLQSSRLASQRSDRTLAKARILQAIELQRKLVAQTPEHQAARRQLKRLEAELQGLTDTDGN